MRDVTWHGPNGGCASRPTWNACRREWLVSPQVDTPREAASHHQLYNYRSTAPIATRICTSLPLALLQQPKATRISMADQSPIDSTPISPVRAGVLRHNSLEKHLQHRPEAQDLKNRHILLDTTTAPYAPPTACSSSIWPACEQRNLADGAIRHQGTAG